MTTTSSERVNPYSVDPVNVSAVDRNENKNKGSFFRRFGERVLKTMPGGFVLVLGTACVVATYYAVKNRKTIVKQVRKTNQKVCAFFGVQQLKQRSYCDDDDGDDDGDDEKD
jgi:hypothetical protein